jgi:ubiquinone/menaquinone biosynthesis C-methylase UbiE
MKDKVQSYYDAFSNTYDNERFDNYHVFLDDSEVNAVKEFLQDKVVLEVGCGTGLILQRLKRHCKDCIGVDLSSGMLSKAKKRGFDCIQADATSLPFRDESFDCVVCFKVLPHIPDAQSAIQEMTRVTKKGGVVALEFYNSQSLRYLVKRIKPASKVAKSVSDKDVFTKYHSPKEMLALLPKNLEVIKMHGIRVFLPTAYLMKVPVLSSALLRLETWCSSTPLGMFGGFMVVVARKGF